MLVAQGVSFSNKKNKIIKIKTSFYGRGSQTGVRVPFGVYLDILRLHEFSEKIKKINLW